MGALEIVFGTTSGITINSGGIEVISAGGADVGAAINSGGLEIIGSGGAASGVTISGGTLEVQSGGSTDSGAVTFAPNGGGTLQLDDSAHFGGLVAGFGLPDLIDFRDIAFNSGTTVTWTQLTLGTNASGTLTVSGGGVHANVTLLGQYIQANFKSASDGHGGTMISDPPVAAQSDPTPPGLVNPHHA